MARADTEKFPSLPPNYVSLAQLQERWLKEKQEKLRKEKEKQQEEEANLAGQNPENHSVKGWIANEPKSESVDGTREKKNKKKGNFHNRKPRVENDETLTVGSVEKGEREVSKGKNQGNKDVKGVGSVSVCMVGENKFDREIPVQKCKDGFKRKEHSKSIIKVVDKADNAENSGQEQNVDKEQEASVGVKWTKAKVKMSDEPLIEVPFGKNLQKRENRSAKGWVAKETKSKEVKTIAPVVEEGGVDRKLGNKKKRGYHKQNKHKVKKDVTRDEVKVATIDVAEGGEITAVESVESGEREVYKGKNQWNKEAKEVATVCKVDVVGENKVDRGIPGQSYKEGFRGNKQRKRMVGIKVGEVGNKAESVEQSRKEHTAETKVEEEVSIDVKENTSEKVRVRDSLHGYDHKRRDEPPLKIERNFGHLSLSDRRNNYGDRWGFGRAKRYEARSMLKQRDSSFVWVKKGEPSNSNAAESETQVDFSSQSTGQSELFSQ